MDRREGGTSGDPSDQDYNEGNWKDYCKEESESEFALRCGGVLAMEDNYYTWISEGMSKLNLAISWAHILKAVKNRYQGKWV